MKRVEVKPGPALRMKTRAEGAADKMEEWELLIHSFQKFTMHRHWRWALSQTLAGSMNHMVLWLTPSINTTLWHSPPDSHSHLTFSFCFMKRKCASLRVELCQEEYGLLWSKQMLNDYKHHIGWGAKQAAVSCACHITAPAWQISSNAQLVFIKWHTPTVSLNQGLSIGRKS